MYTDGLLDVFFLLLAVPLSEFLVKPRKKAGAPYPPVLTALY